MICFKFESADTTNGVIKRYTFESNQQTPYLSKNSCNLVTINSKAEENYLFYRVALNSAFASTSRFYVGGVRSASNQWVWQRTNSPINYGMHWIENGQNNANNNENCLVITKGSDDIGFEDFNCNYGNFGFICEEIIGCYK